MNDVIKGRRRTYTKTFVHRIGVILNTTREMTRGTAGACESMDFTKLLDYAEDLSSAAEAAVKETRNFIESEFATLRGDNDNIEDEEEYFQQKYKSLEFAATKLKQTMKRFSFLNPNNSLFKSDIPLPGSKKCNNEYEPMTDSSFIFNNSKNRVYSRNDRGLNIRHERTSKGGVNFESPI